MKEKAGAARLSRKQKEKGEEEKEGINGRAGEEDTVDVNEFERTTHHHPR